MTTKRAVRRVLAVAVLVLACSDPTGTNGKIETVDGLLARICELAARCTGIAGDVAACPAELRTELSQSQLHELEGFTSFTKVQQDNVLACIGLAICGRFGGNLSNMSDSDVMDPYRSCLGSA